MPATNQIESRSGVSVQNDWRASRKPFAEALENLSSTLDNSTVGVAFFDQQLRCQALNRAFAAVWSLPLGKFLNKTLQQTVGAGAKKLKSSFARVFSGRAVVFKVPLFEISPQINHLNRHSANFYPFADDRRHVRAVAVTICEASTLESHLAQLVAQLQMGLSAATCLLGASFPELLARSLQSSARSIHGFQGSVSSRSLLSGTQVEIDLMPLALFLSLTGSRSAARLPSAPLPATDEVLPLEQGPATEQPQTIPGVEDPSPRELQVLRLLASGRSNKEIGIGLGISRRTVETYRARIIRKLGLHSTAELVRYAVRRKIVDP